jgi:hypothetical protein
MKLVAIKENHLYSKAYSKGKRAVTPAVAVYVLPDYAAKRLAIENSICAQVLPWAARHFARQAARFLPFYFFHQEEITCKRS